MPQGLLCVGLLCVTGVFGPVPHSRRTGLGGDSMYRDLSTWYLQALNSARTAGARASGQVGGPGLSRDEGPGHGGREGTGPSQAA